LTLQITRAQKRFLQSTAENVLYVGGLASGKSWVGSEKTVQLLCRGADVIVMSPTYKNLKLVMMREVINHLNYYKINRKYNRSDQTIELENGAMLFGFSRESIEDVRGITADACVLDEFSLYTKYDYDIVAGRLRGGRIPLQMFMTTTPRGTKNITYEVAKQSGTDVIKQSTAKNPFLPEKYIELLKTQYTTQFSKQELDAEFIDFSAGVLDKDWFKFYTSPPDGVRWVRSWDLAFVNKKSSDYSACALVGMARDGSIYIRDIRRFKQRWTQLKETIREIVKNEPYPIVIENVGSQIALIDELRLSLHKFTRIIAHHPRGDKLTRALNWGAKAENGQVLLWEHADFEEFLDECQNFTADDSHLHDDQIDAVSQAYQYLLKTAQTSEAGDLDGL